MTNFLKTKFPVIVLSLVLSFLFWLRVSGQNMTTHDLVFSLVLNDIPTNIALGDNTPETFNIRVEANTAQARLFTDRRQVLRLDMSDIRPGKNTKAIDREAITSLLPRGVRITRVTPEELVFEAYAYVDKTVPVRVPEIGSLWEALEKKGDLKIVPLEAVLYGPSNRLEDIIDVPTNPFNWDLVRNIGATQILKPQLSGLDSWLKISPNEFRATADVSVKYKNLAFDVPVKLKDLAAFGEKAKNVNFRPQEVAVTVSWPMNLPDPAPSSDGGVIITVTIDPATLERRKSLRVDLEVEHPNPDVRIITAYPQRILATWEEVDKTSNQGEE
ncbi:MAG: hypothetical protein LBE31_04645 [Deltaproteobacteria bacterium]|jgi:YbbR domain-containing protein|nr:hypothetical protein [Deltaproteobacteria bacterium]